MNEPQFNFSSPALIDHDIDGDHIHQRPIDGYINATQMCQAAGKKIHDYTRLNSTKGFLNALSLETGYPVSKGEKGIQPLLFIFQGRPEHLQGTWVHPDVAINLAQWLSPEFAVQVSKWVREWIQGRSSGFMPPHVKRYIKNKSRIPPSHFSMLNEVYLELFAPLDDAGIKIPPKMTPDISTGKMFSDFLRERGIEPSEFPKYDHEYPDGRIVQARLYPIEFLSDFKIWFQNSWLPKRAKSYFQERLPEAVPHILHLLDHSSNTGRPPRIIEGIDDSPENVARAIMRSPPKFE